MPGRARQTPAPNPLDGFAAALSGRTAAPESTVIGGAPARVSGARITGTRAAEGRDGRRTSTVTGNSVEGRFTNGAGSEPVPGFYPNSQLGPNGEGYDEEDVARLLRGMPPEAVARMQRQMQASGLLPANYRAGGFVDSNTRQAFGELLSISNGRGTSYAATLQAMAQGEESLAEMRKDTARRLAQLGQSTRVNTFNRSDPASLRQAAEQGFKQMLGRNPRKDEMEKFVNGFLGAERSNQAAQFAVDDQLAAADRARSMEAAGIQDDAASGGAPAGPLPSEGSESEILMARLKRMIADSPYKIGLGATTRSFAEQVAAKEREKRGGPKAATPGKSKHGNGRANDLQYSSPAAREWALKNAAKYGLAFPIYDPKLPRAKDESWHIEVAKGTAKFAAGVPGGVAPAAVPLSVSVTDQQQDAGAQALEQARRDNPAEAGAYQIGSQFDALLALVQGSNKGGL